MIVTFYFQNIFWEFMLCVLSTNVSKKPILNSRVEFKSFGGKMIDVIYKQTGAVLLNHNPLKYFLFLCFIFI